MCLFERIGAARDVNGPGFRVDSAGSVAKNHGGLSVCPIECADRAAGNRLPALYLMEDRFLIESGEAFERAIEPAKRIGKTLCDAAGNEGLLGDILDVNRRKLASRPAYGTGRRGFDRRGI